MRELPYELKLTYLIAIAVMLLFVGFIIIVVLIYNKRQLVQQQAIQIRESEFRNQLLENELERQKSVQAERERISRDMHDDLGAGISAIKLQAEFIKFRLKDPDYAEDLEAIVKTSEEMNLAMREILWSLNSENDTVGNFVEYTLGYIERFLEKTSIGLEIKKEGIQPAVSLSVKVRRNLFLTVKEAVHNAYKHSDAQAITVIFSQTDSSFKIGIIDNGKGFSESQHANGNGLTNMKIRISAIGGTCEVVPSGSGTHLSFTYAFPSTAHP
jgi:two-component system, NarL family, sensor histidine kinase DesK